MDAPLICRRKVPSSNLNFAKIVAYIKKKL